MVNKSSRAELGLVALYDFFVNDAKMSDTLLHVAELACQAAPADMAGLTLLVDGKPGTGVFTDPAASEIDVHQYASGVGPCLDAFRYGVVNRIDSIEADLRWPEFAASAAAHGIRSTLSLPIAARDEALGALNLYSRQPGAFDQGSVVSLAPFVRQSGIVLANTRVYWDAHDLGENLSQALESRATINYAMGVLMASGGRSPEDAFQLLVRASQRENRKVRVVAAQIVEQAAQRASSEPRPQPKPSLPPVPPAAA